MLLLHPNVGFTSSIFDMVHIILIQTHIRTMKSCIRLIFFTALLSSLLIGCSNDDHAHENLELSMTYQEERQITVDTSYSIDIFRIDTGENIVFTYSQFDLNVPSPLVDGLKIVFEIPSNSAEFSAIDLELKQMNAHAIHHVGGFVGFYINRISDGWIAGSMDGSSTWNIQFDLLTKAPDLDDESRVVFNGAFHLE